MEIICENMGGILGKIEFWDMGIGENMVRKYREKLGKISGKMGVMGCQHCYPRHYRGVEIGTENSC